MTRSASLRTIAPRILLSLALIAGAASSTACGDLGGGGFGGPSIQSATISPDRQPNQSMTDECFTVEMTVSGFESEIEEVTVFLVDRPEKKATATRGETGNCDVMDTPKFQTSGDSLTMAGIPESFLIPNNIDFGNQTEVDFSVGATIVDVDGSEVTQRGITTLTIFDASRQ